MDDLDQYEEEMQQPQVNDAAYRSEDRAARDPTNLSRQKLDGQKAPEQDPSNEMAANDDDIVGDGGVDNAYDENNNGDGDNIDGDQDQT